MGLSNSLSFSNTAGIALLFLGTQKGALADTGEALDVTWDIFTPLQLQSCLFEIIADLADTVHMGKGAQGNWCVMHSTWCTTVAVTCNVGSKVHRSGMKCPQ